MNQGLTSQFDSCAGGRGVLSRVYLKIGPSTNIATLYGAAKYPDNPDYYFIYPSYQTEGLGRYF